MGNVVAVEYVSLDGVMEEPAWSGPYFNDEVAKFQLDNLFSSDALLLGRVTYEGFKAAWPQMTDDEAGFGLRMNAIPKYVASSTLNEGAAVTDGQTLTDGEWNATLFDGDVAEQVARIKREFDGTLLINGSAQLFGALHAAGLIDEYRLMIYPVLVGAGKPLFPAGTTAGGLKLTKSQITGSGVAILTYQPDTTTS